MLRTGPGDAMSDLAQGLRGPDPPGGAPFPARLQWVHIPEYSVHTRLTHT